MLMLFWLVFFLIGACAFPFVLALWGQEIYKQYRGSRAVTCPETRRQVAVSFDALHAAISGLEANKPALRLAECTRWPQRADCGQECIPEALRARPYTQGEVDPPKTKRIYHLPVLIAAVAAWVLGMFWHSEYFFRERWAAALGIHDSQVRQITEWWTPHLLSIAVPLLFAYGVAWLLSIGKQRGLAPGILASTLLWISLMVAALLSAGFAGISRELLRLEAAYTFIASVGIGAIVGGLEGRLVESLMFRERREGDHAVP